MKKAIMFLLLKGKRIKILFVFILITVTSLIFAKDDKNITSENEIIIKVYSKSMQRDLPVLLILPNSYKQTDSNFAVVYFLHGTNNKPITEEGLKELYKSELELSKMSNLYQTIVVAPIVGNSYYLDSPKKDESKFATFVGKELPAYIDKNYRTISSRQGRFLAGFSMGGYGAISLLCRFIDDFSIAASRAGVLDLAFAIHDLD